MPLRRAAILAVLAVALSGCAVGLNPPDAAPTDVQRRAVPGETPRIMLMTVMSSRADTGAHTALLVEGATRVIFNPAGTFVHPGVPEVGDVHHGVTDDIEKAFVDYHVRPAYYMVTQEMDVDAATANRLIALASANGAVGRAMCTKTTSRLLREAGIPVSSAWRPKPLMSEFGALPGVRTRTVTEANVDTDHGVLFGRNGVSTPSEF